MTDITLKNDKLFKDIAKGITTQGYSEVGGSDKFVLFERADKKVGVKLFVKNGLICIKYSFDVRDDKQ